MARLDLRNTAPVLDPTPSAREVRSRSDHGTDVHNPHEHERPCEHSGGIERVLPIARPSGGASCATTGGE